MLKPGLGHIKDSSLKTLNASVQAHCGTSVQGYYETSVQAHCGILVQSHYETSVQAYSWACVQHQLIISFPQ